MTIGGAGVTDLVPLAKANDLPSWRGQSPSGLQTAKAQRVIGYFSFIIMIRQSRLSGLVARRQIVIGG